MKCPAEVYQPSQRVYTGLPDIDYPLHDKTIVVTRCGRICLGKKKINFSTVFAGQAVGIKEVHDDIWLVSFMDDAITRFTVTILSPGTRLQSSLANSTTAKLSSITRRNSKSRSHKKNRKTMSGFGSVAGSNAIRFGLKGAMSFIESPDQQPARQSHVGRSQRHGQTYFGGIPQKGPQCDPGDLKHAPDQPKRSQCTRDEPGAVQQTVEQEDPTDRDEQRR